MVTATPPGLDAERPSRIPPRGWWAIVRRVVAQIGQHNLPLVAAGCAFFTLVALFPAITAAVSLYGLVSDPSQVEAQVRALEGGLPQQALAIMRERMRAVAGSSRAELSWGLAVSLAVALWSASAATRALFSALNIVYREAEKRHIIAFAALSVLFTLGTLIAAIVAILTITLVPAALALVELGPLAEPLVRWMRWPVLALFMMVGLAFLFRFGPSRSRARWRWVSWGAVLATLLWLVASIGFSLYVSHFASFDRTYGSLGAVVVMMLWLFLSAFVVLLGAELNAELEHQTWRDTTTGRPQPPGRRGAFVADHQAHGTPE